MGMYNMKKENIGTRSFRMKGVSFFVLLHSFINLSHSMDLAVPSDTLSLNQSLKYGESLVSSGKTFELGFFTPGTSRKYYLGIWYRSDPKTVVWVANRNNPLNESSVLLGIHNDGNLVLLHQSKGIIWSSNSSKLSKYPIAQLLDSGNLVLQDGHSIASDEHLWQSFDYPSDTMLPGMKLGWNLVTGLESHLTSWNSLGDPSPGDYTYRLSIEGLPQFILSKGTVIKHRMGPWNGIEFTGIKHYPSVVFKPIFVYSETEVYYVFECRDSGINTRLTLSATGLYQRFTAKKGSAAWDITYSRFDQQCDNYNKCGANGICKENKNVSCECMPGFVATSLEEWKMGNWSRGCVRRVPLNCSAEEGFLALLGIELPDLIGFWLDENMSLEECKAGCIKNCSCIAYTNSNAQGGGGGCLMWFGDLIDVKELQEAITKYRQNIYLRLPASVLGMYSPSSRFLRYQISLLLDCC